MEFTKEELANEEWREVVGYEEEYQVSNLGRVRSLKRGKPYLMKPYIVRGYLQVHLKRNGDAKMFSIHRLVLTAFLPNKDNLPQINHKDENKQNNRLDNLEWCDASYNVSYGSRNRRMIETRRLTKSGNYPKPVIQMDLSGNVIAQYESLMDAYRKTNIDYSNISKCCRSSKRKVLGNSLWEFAPIE